MPYRVQGAPAVQSALQSTRCSCGTKCLTGYKVPYRVQGALQGTRCPTGYKVSYRAERNIEVFTETYQKGKSFLHMLDPRIKLIYLLFFSVVFFLPVSVMKYYTVFLLIFISACIASGFRNVMGPIKVIMPLLILIMLLTPLFHPEGAVIFKAGNFVILTSPGLNETLHLVGRFLGITVLFFIFLRTTRIDDFVLALRYFGLSHKNAVVITITVRYIPYLMSVYENTVDAHKMRLTINSVIPGRWNFPARFKNLLSVLTSVLIQAVKGIPVLAMALETRGFGRKTNPGQLKRMKGLKELIFDIILSFILFLGILYYIFL